MLASEEVASLNLFLCFWSELATNEVVLHGAISLESKICSQNVHFHDSFWSEQTLAATKLVLSLTRIDFAMAVSSRAIHISSSLGLYVFFLIRDLFSYGFLRKLRTGPYRSYDKSAYFYLPFLYFEDSSNYDFINLITITCT